MGQWGRNSIKNINTVDFVLQLLSQKIITRVPFDIGVLKSGGIRTTEEQNAIFKAGNSKCDGYEKLSYHQSGKAIDYVPYIDSKFTWSNGLAFLSNAKHILNIWQTEIVEANLDGGCHLHWGGFWGAKDLDGDGYLEVDEKLGWDMAHFELRKYPQKNTFEIEV